MLSLEEFKNKLKGIKREIDNASSNTKLKKEPYIIPEEFKGHYFGKWGECAYDTRMFVVCGAWNNDAHLRYKQDCGLPPVIPEGYTSCYCMFMNCGKLIELDLSRFDTSGVTCMECMFECCSSLKKLDLSRFDTAEVENMNGMFCDCASLTAIDLSNLDMSNVKYMNGMFLYCESLKTVDFPTLVSHRLETAQWHFMIVIV